MVNEAAIVSLENFWKKTTSFSNHKNKVTINGKYYGFVFSNRSGGMAHSERNEEGKKS